MRFTHLRIRIAPVLLLNLLVRLTSVNITPVLPPVPLVLPLMAVRSQNSLMTSGEKTYVCKYVSMNVSTYVPMYAPPPL